MSGNDWDGEERRELKLHFRRRSDESATALRALLLAVTTLGAGFAGNRLEDTQAQLCPLLCFLAAVVLLVASWNMQKSKSLARLGWLEEGLRKADFNARDKAQIPNWQLDFLAQVFILFGFIAELLVLLKSVQ